jgi:hypothetical protein
MGFSMDVDCHEESQNGNQREHEGKTQKRKIDGWNKKVCE